MILIFGGAYQGKLEYAKNRYQITDVYTCSEADTSIDFSHHVIYGLEDFALACVKNDVEAKDYLMTNRSKLEDKIIICTDMSQGIVPMDPQLRALREMAGRAMIYLAAEARTVTRVFCGLGQDIKP